jgi:hypothetical protein
MGPGLEEQADQSPYEEFASGVLHRNQRHRRYQKLDKRKFACSSIFQNLIARVIDYGLDSFLEHRAGLLLQSRSKYQMFS